MVTFEDGAIALVVDIDRHARIGLAVHLVVTVLVLPWAGDGLPAVVGDATEHQTVVVKPPVGALFPVGRIVARLLPGRRPGLAVASGLVGREGAVGHDLRAGDAIGVDRAE